MAPVSKRLGELLGVRVFQAPEVVGPEVRRGAARLDPGEILTLENTRWDSGETKHDPHLARDLADLADAFVLDAFGSAHRAHASTVGVAEHLPSADGPLLENEVTTLEGLIENPERPLTVVLGGAKVTDKIALIDRFLDLADQLLIGGAMSFSFFRAQGHETGNSLIDDDSVQSALSALEKADSARATLILPVDLVIADRFAADAKTRERAGVDVPDGWMGLDIGPRTAQLYAGEISRSGTVFWNGPMGAFEMEPFAAGTRAVADAVAGTMATTVVGGGDSGAALSRFGLAERVTHLSTGGAAALDRLEGKPRRGVEALDDA